MRPVNGSTTIDRSDESSRRLIREAVDETLVVEAAAGTGKTTELVNRILKVLATGRADVRGIVAVTFTEKAAGELKLRLRQGLEEERRSAVDPSSAARLEDAVQSLEEAHVSTIHGFCADLLRERPVEAGIDPLFRVLTEGQAEQLFNQAFSAWLQTQLEHPPEGVRRSLRRGSRGFRPGDADDDGPIERLRRAAWDLTEWRDFRGAWARDPFDRSAAVERLIDLVHDCADLSSNASYAGDNLFLDTEPIRRLSREMRSRAATAPQTRSSRVVQCRDLASLGAHGPSRTLTASSRSSSTFDAIETSNVRAKVVDRRMPKGSRAHRSSRRVTPCSKPSQTFRCAPTPTLQQPCTRNSSAAWPSTSG